MPVTLDNGSLMGDLSSVISAVSYASFEKVLAKLDARLTAGEVHALYLGAITSTSFQLGPQRLLHHIFGDKPTLGESVEDANDNLQVLFGYWNTILAEKKAGRLGLAPLRLPARPTTHDLLGYARRRQEELLWYIRGIAAGGDDPMEFGSDGKKLLEGVAKGGAYVQAYVDLLEREPPATPKELQEARDTLLGIVDTIETIIGDLMDVSDHIRREAMHTFAAREGQPTDDGGHITRSVKVGRNEACPCGSGKKWKKCCGRVAPVQ